MNSSTVNIIGSILAGLCPWGNLLFAWGISLLEGEYQAVRRLTALIILEFVLSVLMFAIEVPEGLFAFLGITAFVTLVIAWFYSTSIFMNDSQRRSMKAFRTIWIAWVVSNFSVLMNIALIILAKKDNKLSWTRYPMIVLLITVFYLIFSDLNVVSGRSYLVMTLLNTAIFTFWVFSKKIGYDMSIIVTALRGGSYTNTAATNTITSTSPTTSNRSVVNNVNQSPFGQRRDQIREKNTSSMNNIYEKGWSVDDTIGLQVELLTIEDIIFPLMLKNEYEKCVKDLIIYIRKLNRYSDSEIEKALGSGGLCAYLDTFFPRLKMDFVRTVYLRSLHILLKDYAEKRDSRVESHLDKLVVKVLN
ncbi:hypothetical protein LJC00_01260 [Dysgonomonas sp. OttesenSCG-928-M03]|nr:hypothetical protein [Dysgonomonas sp. OttesenSCG-928-M03]